MSATMLRLDDLKSWVIAYAGSVGQGYVGRLADDANAHEPYQGCIDLLAPYVLTSGYVVTPQKQIGRPFVLFPLELLVGAPSLRVHYTALLRLRDLEPGDFEQMGRDLLQAIGQAEEIRGAVRQARSGIVLAPVLPTNPIPKPGAPRLR